MTRCSSDTSTVMKIVGRLSKTLLAPADLGNALEEAGNTAHFRRGSILFQAGDKNIGIFLVCSGRVCLSVPEAPQFDRMFSAGSILGLPSTFLGKPYSLTAACFTDCDVVLVRKKQFLELMTRRLDLCRTATDILSREVTFIFSALGKRSRESRNDRYTKGPVSARCAPKTHNARSDQPLVARRPNNVGGKSKTSQKPA
jgi:CRP-like cAMP-binding protein